MGRVMCTRPRRLYDANLAPGLSRSIAGTLAGALAGALRVRQPKARWIATNSISNHQRGESDRWWHPKFESHIAPEFEPWDVGLANTDEVAAARPRPRYQEGPPHCEDDFQLCGARADPRHHHPLGPRAAALDGDFVARRRSSSGMGGDNHRGHPAEWHLYPELGHTCQRTEGNRSHGCARSGKDQRRACDRLRAPHLADQFELLAIHA